MIFCSINYRRSFVLTRVNSCMSSMWYLAIVYALLSTKLIKVKVTSRFVGNCVFLMSCIIICSWKRYLDISSINSAAFFSRWKNLSKKFISVYQKDNGFSEFMTNCRGRAEVCTTLCNRKSWAEKAH